MSREDFEKWAKKEEPTMDLSTFINGAYIYAAANTSFRAWQAAAKGQTTKQKGVMIMQQDTQYDYVNQCWIVDGLIKDCSHPASMPCGCYGREHKGEAIINTNQKG